VVSNVCIIGYMAFFNVKLSHRNWPAKIIVSYLAYWGNYQVELTYRPALVANAILLCDTQLALDFVAFHLNGFCILFP
jgi:hypothetical protein